MLLAIEKVALLSLIVKYYPQSWMIDYLDQIVNSIEPETYISNMYLSEEGEKCNSNDNYYVSFPFYGT